MKNIMITLAVAMICFTACRKQQAAAPAATTTDARLNDSRATIAGLHNKKIDNGVDLDYDLVLKKGPGKSYGGHMLMHDIMLGSSYISKYKKGGLKPGSFTKLKLTLSIQENGKTVVLLKETEIKVSSDKKDNFFTIPSFDYDGDLTYDMIVIDASGSITPEDYILETNDKTSFSLFGNDFSSSSVIIDGGNFTLKENSAVKVNGTETYINFGISANKSEAWLTFHALAFVLPSGHTEVQDPKVAKVKLEEGKDGTFGYMTVTVTDDPAHAVTGVTYQPKSVSANDPKDPKAMIVYPVMKFELTHINGKNGVLRFKSTQTWQAVYGKEKVSPLYDAKGLEVQSALYSGGH